MGQTIPADRLKTFRVRAVRFRAKITRHRQRTRRIAARQRRPPQYLMAKLHHRSIRTINSRASDWHVESYWVRAAGLSQSRQVAIGMPSWSRIGPSCWRLWRRRTTITGALENWLGRQGSNLGWRYQKPLPYRLATPQLSRNQEIARQSGR